MKFSNAVVVGVLSAFAAGCAYLPTGYPSRTNKTPTGDLFVSSSSGSSSVQTPARPTAPATGLQIRKSKRGNMDSYVVRGQRYYTMDSADGYSARGVASWYGPNFHGRTASNGEVYDMYRLTAAHKTLPLPTYARVTHIENGRSVIVKINDRGPFSGERIIDLSFAAALRLGMVNDGTGMVEVQALSPEEMVVLSGPDNKLGIEFYYAAGEEEPVVAPELNVEAPEDDLITVAAVEVDDKPILPQPISKDPVASDELLITDASASDITEIPVVVAGRVPPVDGVEALPMQQPAAGSTEDTDLMESALLPGLADANVQGVTTVPAAVQAVKLPSDKDRSGYYIQAGVFADVEDAERIAIDAVLAAPGEEVNVKPLKNSHMYRITVGPIVSSEHSVKVAGLLTSAGIDNFTVRVK